MALNILSLKGSIVGSSLPALKDKEIPNTIAITIELRETLYIKLLNTFLRNRKDLKVFLL
jgi:hypothetical protein